MTHGEKAEQLFYSGYNCAQAVVCAYIDELPIPEETAIQISSSFGGGMGRLRETCGAFSAILMVAGLKKASLNPSDRAAKAEHYALVQQLAKDYKEANGSGSIICREILGLSCKGADDPTPEKRTDSYYKKRPCPELCRIACDVLDKRL